MVKRIAVIDRDVCQPAVCGYYLCHKVCPVDRAGIECITVSETDKKPLINEDTCISCMICVKKCPVDAIRIVNLPDELTEPPVHRYGPNLFALYRLPLPKKQAVVALMGPNGVGKSTVLEILAGLMVPNNGAFELAPAWKEAIARWKGTELQAYLEDLAGGTIRAAYKPQQVDLIPKTYAGKVRDLLGKVNERGVLDEVVHGLGAGEMLDKEVAELSGGELQLFAIIGTIVKDCGFYFFDEPSGYLDVQERLLAAKEIRKLAGHGVVMVVEHDLAMADYLADYTHILYGRPATFGVVSRPFGVRVGINTYLDGYIKEENMRFRPDSIAFPKTAKVSEKKTIRMEFPAFGKRFGRFSLKTASGSIYRGEIIGVLGQNSIGKTTFIRMLAGQLEPDNAESPHELRVAYKPQRLVLQDEEEMLPAREFLRPARLASEDSKKIIRVMGLEKLLDRQMGSLSGGELQAIFIAASLMQDSDIILLDEPSAFLDAEHRLELARLLRTHVEMTGTPCFVVDHDLQFMDAVSDRVMVFSGTRGVTGEGNAICGLQEGMNRFLRSLDITFRRDPQTGRPRANKQGSQKEQEQKEQGEYYYG